jgi:hypothetical protein
VNGGLARSGDRRVTLSVVRPGRKDRRASELPREKEGKDRRKAQGGARAPSSGRFIARAVQRSRDRGCNGHRIPGRVSCRTKASRIINEASRSREPSTGGLGVPPHSPTRAPRPKAEGTATCSPREGVGGARVNEGARQGCQRLDRSRRRGKKTPTLMTEAARCSSWDSRRRRSAKAGSDAVKRPVPRSCRTEPKTPWGVPVAKAASASREHTRCGCTFLEWVAEIDRTHRASSAPGGPKASW